MNNELMLRNEEYIFSNHNLTKQAEIIRKTSNTILEGAMKIGRAFKEIKDKELWKDDFANFEKFADSVGYKKSSAYNLITAYEISSTYNLKEYTAGQCLELRTLEKAEGQTGIEKALSENGFINPTMSSKAIRQAIKNHLNPPKDESLVNETETITQAVEMENGEKVDIPEFIEDLLITHRPVENRITYYVNGRLVATSKIPAILEYIEKINEIMNS